MIHSEEGLAVFAAAGQPPHLKLILHDIGAAIMASVNDLPAELLYQIVDYLQLVSQSIIGGNAVWTSVPRFLASQPLYPVPDVFSVPITLNDEDGPDDDDGCDEAVDRLSTTVAVTDDEEKLRTTPLKALRL